MPVAKKRATSQQGAAVTATKRSYRRRSKGPEGADLAAAAGAEVEPDGVLEESTGAADSGRDGGAQHDPGAHEAATGDVVEEKKDVSKGDRRRRGAHEASQGEHAATGDVVEEKKDVSEGDAEGTRAKGSAASDGDQQLQPRQAFKMSARTREAITTVESRSDNILKHEVKLDDAVITSLLEAIPFDELVSHRSVNGPYTKGFCLGLIRSGAFVELASNTKRFPKLCAVLQKYIAKDMPWFTYTGIQLNAFKSEAEHLVQYGHCDVHDAEGKEQALRGFGKYCGGEVFVADPAEYQWTVPKRYAGGISTEIPDWTPTSLLKEPYKPGMQVYGKLIDVSKDWAIFSGHRYHCPQQARGVRYTLVYFTCQVHLKNKAGLTPSKLMNYMEGGWPIAALPTDDIINVWGPLEADHLASIGNDSDME